MVLTPYEHDIFRRPHRPLGGRQNLQQRHRRWPRPRRPPKTSSPTRSRRTKPSSPSTAPARSPTVSCGAPPSIKSLPTNIQPPAPRRPPPARRSSRSPTTKGRSAKLSATTPAWMRPTASNTSSTTASARSYPTPSRAPRHSPTATRAHSPTSSRPTNSTASAGSTRQPGWLNQDPTGLLFGGNPRALY